jgi:hypothetical protein
LNPIVRVRRDLKDDMAGLQFTTLEAQQIICTSSSAMKRLPFNPSQAILISSRLCMHYIYSEVI